MLPLLSLLAQSQPTLPAPTGDFQKDWLNMLGWLVAMILGGTLVHDRLRRKPPVGEDLTKLAIEVKRLSKAVEEAKEEHETLEDELRAELKELHKRIDPLSTDLAAVESTLESHTATLHTLDSKLDRMMDRLGCAVPGGGPSRRKP